jgi:AAA family ATP:ADP antiporter
MTEPVSQEQTTVLDRALRLFAPVRGGEGGTVLLMALNVFLLLTAYYIIKPVREALILAEWGAEAKIYASAGQALLLLGVIPLYSRLADMMRVRRLIATVLLFFAACLVAFYLLAKLDVPLGIPFYLWVGIFNMMVVAQFWSFANDYYTEEQGKRLFAIIGFGMSAGAVFGGFITKKLIHPLGLYQLMLLSAALLIVSLLLTLVAANRRNRSRVDEVLSRPVDQEKMEGPGGFALVMKNRYLLLIAVMMVLANLVNTTGEYILGARVTDTQEKAVAEVVQTPGMSRVELEAAQEKRQDQVGEAIGDFYAGFFAIVNLVGLLTQLFLVSRIVAWFGVNRAIMVLPLVAVGGYIMIALFPVLSVARWAKTAENSTDYSLQNTVRNMLFLPTTRAEKFKAKQAIDAFFVRAGDVLAALVVLGGTTLLGLAPSGFALVNIIIALLWAVLAFFIGRRYLLLSHSR